MLIVAIPKSMSSSLKKFLSSKEGLHSEYQLPSLPSAKSEWPWTHRFTNACVNFNEKIAKRLCNNQETIWKFHIPPTDQNVEVFFPYKKVILLRNPKDVIFSWRRTALKKGRRISGLPFDTSFLKKPEKQWLQRAKSTGLWDEIRKFYAFWSQQEKNVLHIDYVDLLNFPKKTVNDVEKFFDLPISKNVVMPKIRYTRG